MVQIHSPRPFLLEPIVYGQTYSRRPPGVGPGGRRSKSNRPDHGIARSLIGLHLDCEVFCNMRNLSNLSNSCLTTSPTDKESGYSEVRSGCRIGVGESKLLASSDYKVWVEHSALDRMLEHVLPIKFAELVERKTFVGNVSRIKKPCRRAKENDCPDLADTSKLGAAANFTGNL